ncbi:MULTISPECIES: BON domain-containing protein [Vibrio]|uniref:BON domain-containing protein n=2 Tax=Vibrio TaxID=662 RepID=A0A7X4RWX7_9VIBR|nr:MULTISPECIES: BON domain-containing protein [Vibrio]MBF9003303.1 BON domain-containing protein [Vibrio nitrifigilis]MZI95679.1 BON domain-containing protein [Vibrio eleionomae]
MKNMTKNLLITSMLCTTSMSTFAASSNQWKNKSMDAWVDGKAETVLLLNTNLNSFDINTDVEHGVVTLTGKVDNDVDKDLAGELVEGLDGVKDVENKLTVIDKQSDDADSSFGQLNDAKITSIVKTRLLMDSNVSGTNIDVSTNNGVVTLEGQLDTDAQQDLAINIAQNTADVTQVVDEITVTQ